ncbi:MAG: carbonic anhydrase family protein [Bacteroidota bacterium]
MHTKESQERLTPEAVRLLLQEGNIRFLNNTPQKRNFINEVKQSSSGQYPVAAILSCIDSRTPAEIIFDQGLGDIFNIRIAGNIVNEDILGSMEFACKVANAKLIVVMGHTKCGAITSAYNEFKMGFISNLLSKVQPAINMVKETKKQQDNVNDDLIENVILNNIQLTIEQIRNESKLLQEMETSGHIRIIGALYDIATGKVEFK